MRPEFIHPAVVIVLAIAVVAYLSVSLAVQHKRRELAREAGRRVLNSAKL